MAESRGRERIITAALELIGSEGVGGVTNRKIAARAGISLGSITYHFASQRELLTESLLHFVRTETERLAGIARTWQDSEPSLEQAARIVEIVAAQTIEDTEQTAALAPYELYIHAGRDIEVRAAAAESFAAYDALAVTVLRALGVADPDELAPSVVALVLGTQLRRLATGHAGTDVATTLTRMLTAG